MPDAIFPLTTAVLEDVAREKAEQHIPVEEANWFVPGTALWAQFNDAYARHAAKA